MLGAFGAHAQVVNCSKFHFERSSDSDWTGTQKSHIPIKSPNILEWCLALSSLRILYQVNAVKPVQNEKLSSDDTVNNMDALYHCKC